MQVDTPEISYHNDIKPILAVDLHPSGRMATGGADHMVRVWQLHKSNDSTPSSDSPMAPASSTSLTFLANLEFHQQPVNAVRFSPDGKYLASASDDHWVVIWQRVDTDDSPASDATAAPIVAVDATSIDLTATSGGVDATAGPSASPAAVAPAAVPFGADPDDCIESKEKWVQFQRMRGHVSEIYDLCWSPNSKELLTGSIDNHCLVWSLSSGSFLQTLKDHSGYVQGVSWDPLNQFIATQSSDRTVKIYERKRNMRSKANKPQIEFVERSTIKNRKTMRIGKNGEANSTTNEVNTAMMTPRQKLQPKSLSLDSPTSNNVETIELDGIENSSIVANVAIDTSNKSLIVGSSLDDVPSPKKDKDKSSSNTITRSLFMDDAHPSYFRRLAFSPDGSFLLTPAGIFHADELATTTMTTPTDEQEPSPLLSKMKSESTSLLDSDGPNTSRSSMPTCYIFHRSDGFTKPIAHLPQLDPVVVVKFAPRLWKVRDGEQIMQGLPYRMIFAVGTTKHILLYDTDSSYPLCIIKNIHHSGLTDLSWSTDGLTLISSSSDGFCSYIYINQEKIPELGEIMPEEEMALYREFWSSRRDQISLAVTEGKSESGADGDKKKKKTKLAGVGGESAAKTAIVTLLGAEPAPLPTWTGGESASANGGANSTSSTTPSSSNPSSAPKKENRSDEDLWRHAFELLQNRERLTATRIQHDCGTGPSRAKKVISELEALGSRALNRSLTELASLPIPFKCFEEVLAAELAVDCGVDLRTAKGRPVDPPIPYTITPAEKKKTTETKKVTIPAALDALQVGTDVSVTPLVTSNTATPSPVPHALVQAMTNEPIEIDQDTPTPTNTNNVKDELPTPKPIAEPIAAVTPAAITPTPTIAAPIVTPLPVVTPAATPIPSTPVKSHAAATTALLSPHSTPAKAANATGSPATATKTTPTAGAGATCDSANKKKRKLVDGDSSATKPKTPSIMDMFKRASAAKAAPNSATKSNPATPSTHAAAAAAVVDLTKPSVSLEEVPIAQPRAKRRITPELVSDAAAKPVATPPAATATANVAVVAPPAAAAAAAPVAAPVAARFNSDSSDSDSDVEEEFVVDRLLKKKGTGNETRYLVKWVGYDSSENTWEPEENLPFELIKEFEKSHKKPRRVVPTLITNATATTTKPTPPSTPAKADTPVDSTPPSSTAPVEPFLASVTAATSISSLSPTRKRKANDDDANTHTTPAPAPAAQQQQPTPTPDSNTDATVHRPEVKKAKRKIVPQAVL